MVATLGRIDANFFGEGARSPDRGGSTPREEFFAYGRSAHRKDARARYRYIGVERDEETGLCMTGPRTYDPVVGRFHQGDPAVKPGSSPFAYSRGHPTRMLDPNGYNEVPASIGTPPQYEAQICTPENPTGVPPATGPPLSDLLSSPLLAPLPEVPTPRAGADGMVTYIGEGPNRTFTVPAGQDPPGLANRVPALEAQVAGALPGVAGSLLLPGPDDVVAAGLVGGLGRAGRFAGEMVEQLPSNAVRVGRTVEDTIGKEAGARVRGALKGTVPLSDLTEAERMAAAAFYRDVATRTGGQFAKEAAQYNVARAEFLEGARESLPPTLPEFIRTLE